MSSQDFITSFAVDQTPQEVFAAITNVRGWWTGDIEGGTDTLGDEFTYRYGDAHYSKQKITELIPEVKVAWRVLDGRIAFAGDTSEWIGTEITFDVAPQGKQTEIRFAHLGLVPKLECFDSCSSAWGFYINASLRRLITKGEGPATPPWA